MVALSDGTAAAVEEPESLSSSGRQTKGGSKAVSMSECPPPGGAGGVAEHVSVARNRWEGEVLIIDSASILYMWTRQCER